jgi:DNA topoisomerase-1
VNAYLREIGGEDFTAKDFRTWSGTVLASRALREFEAFGSETQAKKNVVQAIKAVAERLGNTPAVCRKCYVHPAVLECYMTGSLAQSVKRKIDESGGEKREELLHEEEAEELQKEDRTLMQLLRERLAGAEKRAAA